MGGTSSLSKGNKRESREDAQFYKFHTKAKALISKDSTTSVYPLLYQEWMKFQTRKPENIDSLREATGRVLLLGATRDIAKGEKPLLVCYEDLFAMSKYFADGNYYCISTQGPLINNGKEPMTKEFCLKAIEEEISQLSASNCQHSIIYFTGQAKSDQGWVFRDGNIAFKDILEIWNRKMAGSQEKELAIIVDTNYSGEWCDSISEIRYPCKIGIIATCLSGKTSVSGILAHSFVSYIQKDKEIFESIKKHKIQFQAALNPVFNIFYLQDWLYFVDKYTRYLYRAEVEDIHDQIKKSVGYDPSLNPVNGPVEVIQQKVGKTQYITINAPEGSNIAIGENMLKPSCPKGHRLVWTSDVIKCSGCYGHSIGFSCKECQYYLGVECYKKKFDINKCPNDHKLYWTSNERECAQCQSKGHGKQCVYCQFHLCSHCSKVAIRPDICPNNHSLKWYSAPAKCLRCVSYCSGMECKACGYRICTDCSEVPLPKNSCMNGHSLHWTKKEHECLKCKEKLCGKMCPACDYFLCNRDADVVYEKDKCPNSHPLQISFNEILCMMCLRKAKGARCHTCSYNVCSNCIDGK